MNSHLFSIEKFKWYSPCQVAKAVYLQYEELIFLYSTNMSDYSGRFSFLAFDVSQRIESDDIHDLESILTTDIARFQNFWLGYLGYELKNSIESFIEDNESYIQVPALLLVSFNNIIVFDHQEQCVNYYYDGNKETLLQFECFLEQSLSLTEHQEFLSLEQSLLSNMTTSEYLDKLNYVKEKIIDGDIYQANLTRKFYGTVKNPNNLLDVFSSLCKFSPSCYSAFLSLNGICILSSSPEQFLTIDEDGHMESRPIKGTSPRYHENQRRDEESKTFLENSEKDKAENLMIVDLMRNDFSKSAEIGSVEVRNLFNINSYQTVHHMDSTIGATKSADVTTSSVIKGCFPPGSMTGTPKIRAMEICSEVEQQKRGVYSGAIGWFGGDGTCDLSVVIRTIVIQGNKFEFQVGGAITFDSDPQAELEETIAKSRALLHILAISESDMREL